MSEAAHTRLQQVVAGEAQKKNTHAVLVGVQSVDGQVDFVGAAGAAQVDSPYYIASVTKLYTAAVMMQLVDDRLVDLDAPLSTYLPPDTLNGIHVLKGLDYSHQLRVHHLLHQTSGLADYFEGKAPGGSSLLDDLKQGQDREYDLADVLAMVRPMSPAFVPGANNGRKSHYSDTNYQLLGAIIVAVTGQSIAQNYQARIFDRLGLAHTYLYDYTTPRGPQPLPVYNQDRALDIPKTMSSVGPDGGIVSTLADSLVFLRAYFAGDLFDAAHFPRMMAQWNTVFFPIQYGYGLMRYHLPRAMTLFRYSPEFIGHSGVTGSFAFHAPKEDLFIVGTVNQVDQAARPFRLLPKVVSALT
ncbi:MAG: beta-lactamase family protein [Chloroflexi bacterium]|nr:beta-lactamase family protein [Chloroflexota bacterium]